VQSSCERGNEPSGSIKAGNLPSGCTTCGLSSGTQLYRVSQTCMNFRKSKSCDHASIRCGYMQITSGRTMLKQRHACGV
jgi:hypothetical protein